MIIIESIILCLFFTTMVFFMAKNPIKTLYNYPPKIQEKVKSMVEYKDKIPTNKNKIVAKITAALIIILIASLIVRYINNCTSFLCGFKVSFIIWSIVNIYDVVVMDILWFCQDKRFIFPGTEHLIKEYKNYWFHIKEGFIGELIGLFCSIIIGIIVTII